jgi:hypothetical protein
MALQFLSEHHPDSDVDLYSHTLSKMWRNSVDLDRLSADQADACLLVAVDSA